MALGFWAKDYLGPKEAGGGGVLVVPVVTDFSMGKSTLQRSYKDLLGDFDSGKVVFAAFPNESGYKQIRLVSFVGELINTGRTVRIAPSEPSTSVIVATASGENDFPSWDDE